MNYIKKANILQILLLTLALTSCKNETKSASKRELSDAELPKAILPKMKPLENETPKLTVSYIEEKRKEIDSFYKKKLAQQQHERRLFGCQKWSNHLRKIRRLCQL